MQIVEYFLYWFSCLITSFLMIVAVIIIAVIFIGCSFVDPKLTLKKMNKLIKATNNKL